MKFGIVVFPGSNCDADSHHVVTRVLGCPAEYLWHKETSLKNSDVVILPGGFSYGDYLRCGAIAKFSPIMTEVRNFARRGGRVIGICNGFQVLVETGLLPGTLIKNRDLKFICDWVDLRLENTRTLFTGKGKKGATYRMPIAHGEGNYFIDPDGLKRLEDGGQVVFRYADSSGRVTEEANPNGSLGNIAGICNEKGNILGMMPHPERASETLLGSEDGRFIFESLIG
ncbi:MAG: phosphoribosylformylglycinamidine synthase subunit PurQ [Deltaproteobacteria bacterium]|nr:phosphoribosylformylglycinamidine synthase subunit PurQ [Deltaproteobacteria bacterium]